VRVLFVAPTDGGVAAVSDRLIGVLCERGLDVEALAFERGDMAAWRALSALWRTRRALRRADVVHVELGRLDAAPFWYGLLAAWLKRPIVLGAHDVPELCLHPAAGLVPTGPRVGSVLAYRVLAPLLDHRFSRALARRARAGVVLSEAAREGWIAADAGAPAAIVVTDHGADPPVGGPPPSRGGAVLLAGFLGPGKGVDILLDAWARVGAASAIPLCIAGDVAGDVHRPWLDEQRARAAALPAPPVWLGSLDEDGWLDALGSAAIVVLPYRVSNPASGVLVRAMVEGRAVVATRVPAMTGVIEDGVSGVLVDPDDAAGLAAALQGLLEDPERRDSLGAAAAAYAGDHFTWDRHVDGVLRGYGEAMR
jgi:glycosyltransferase involved in cell wall biosynthesis